jgi:hypothetical protein
LSDGPGIVFADDDCPNTRQDVVELQSLGDPDELEALKPSSAAWLTAGPKAMATQTGITTAA